MIKFKANALKNLPVKYGRKFKT